MEILLKDIYPGMSIREAHVDELREQDENANVQAKWVFDQLKSNIQIDKRLETLPLVCLKNRTVNKKKVTELQIISGHHRIRAARMANVTNVKVLCIDEELTPDQIRSKQLAHNSLTGEDDPEILKRIFEKIRDETEKLRAGIRNFENPKLAQMDISKVEIEFRSEVVNIVFLDTQAKKFHDVINRLADYGTVYVEDVKNFDSFAEMVRQVSKAKKVRSIAGILSQVSDIVLEHLKKGKASEK